MFKIVVCEAAPKKISVTVHQYGTDIFFGANEAQRNFQHFWCPRQESNLYLGLRSALFYPLNYGDVFEFD